MSDPRAAHREEHQLLSLFMAIAVHALLVLGLIFAVHWKTQKPAAIEVELWGGPPPAAVREADPQPEKPVIKQPKPAPVIEKPAPVEKNPDIATGKTKPTPVVTLKPTMTPRPSATPKPTIPPTAVPKPTVLPQPTRPPKPTHVAKKSTFDDLLNPNALPAAEKKPNAKPEGKTAGSGNNTAAKVNATGTGVGGGGADNDKLRGYGNSVAQLIKSRIPIYPGSDNPRVEFKITLFPDGTIRELRLIGGDGNSVWQNNVTSGIQSLGTFPPPPAGVRYDDVKSLNFSFRPKD